LEIQEVLKKVSEGHLNVKVKGDYKGDYAELKNALTTPLTHCTHILKKYPGYLLKWQKEIWM